MCSADARLQATSQSCERRGVHCVMCHVEGCRARGARALLQQHHRRGASKRLLHPVRKSKPTSPLAKHKHSLGFPKISQTCTSLKHLQPLPKRLSFSCGAPLYSLAAHSSRTVQ